MAPSSPSPPPPALRLATFNVKDLFSPRAERPEEAPLFERKVAALVASLAAVDADVVALQEVGDDPAFARVTAAAGYPHVVLAEGDRRGIRCALLSRLAPLASGTRTTDELPFPSFVKGDPSPYPMRLRLRRPVPHVRVRDRAGHEVDVLTVHLKSKLPLALKDFDGYDIVPTTARERAEGSLRSLVARSAEALFVRQLVDELETRDGAAHDVAVLGDFNDVAGSVPLRVIAGDGPGALVDCVASLTGPRRTTTLHGGRAETIDHVLASPRLAARVTSARVWNERLRDHGPFAPGKVALTEDSDHALVSVDFG